MSEDEPNRRCGDDPCLRTEDDGASTTRRAALAGAAGFGAALVAGCNALGRERADVTGTAARGSRQDGRQPDVATGPVRVGVLLSEHDRYLADQTRYGFYAGLDYKSDGSLDRRDTPAFEVTVDGVDYELYVRQMETLASKSSAGGLVDDVGVDVVYGGQNWVDQLDIARSIEDADGEATYVAGSVGAELSNPDLCRDWVFQTGETYAMDGRTGARYLRDHADADSAFLVGREHEETTVLGNYRDVLLPSDVELLGQRIVYQDVQWSALFEMASERGADAVVVGARPAKWAEAYATLLVGDYDLQVVGPAGGRQSFADLAWAVRQAYDEVPDAEELRAAGVGPLTCRYHPSQFDNPVNESLVGFLVDHVGVLPDESAAAAFTGASAVHQAVLAVRDGSASSIPDALHGATVADTPKGTDAYAFQDRTNQARSPMTVARPAPTPDRDRETWLATLAPEPPIDRVPAAETVPPPGAPGAGCDP